MWWLALRKLLPDRSDVHVVPLLHSMVQSVGALYILYAEHLADPPEPLRSIRCAGPLTLAHTAMPAILLGYAASDLAEGLSTGAKDYVVHGLLMGTLVGMVCHMGLQHTIACCLVMEVSTVFLSLRQARWATPGLSLMFDMLFVTTFLFTRIVYMPMMWATWLLTYHGAWQTRHQALAAGAIQGDRNHCLLPEALWYIAVPGGVTFHALNGYWATFILRKTVKRLALLVSNKGL